MMDLPDSDDTLKLYVGHADTTGTDMKLEPLSTYVDVTTEESYVEFKTDKYVTGHGFTLIWQPDYPEVEFASPGLPMAQGAAGFRVVSVYGDQGSQKVTTEKDDDGATTSTKRTTEYRTAGADTVGDTYVETIDWLVPNVTCTPTTMHCPLPTVWAHINYTTPSLYPEPAEGSCLQQKTGTSSLAGCGEKKNLDKRWYSANSPATSQPGNSKQNTDEEDNGQLVADDAAGMKHANWAGNCGDASSYFWFEKIACGSTRTFLTDRSLIEDFVQLTPTWEDIQAILDLYYTTKAPLQGAADGDGLTFINADYHVAPVLPPKVNCTCLAAMDAYASLLSVVSKTPTPGAPVTLDPEVLNAGTSKMIATLRAYQDPTYSIPASSTVNMPMVVSRFYLEVSTKFTRNRITISDCTAASQEVRLNQSNALAPKMNYCNNSTFDTMTERAPNGVTHMDRLSMKKFKFQSTTDVFLQCKIRACAQQPCGVCKDRRQLSVDLSAVEGEMFAPPTQVKVSTRDKNALVFPDTAYSAEGHSMYETSGVSIMQEASSASSPSINMVAATSMPIEVSSELTLTSVTAAWAVENRVALTETLRSTLGLKVDESLVITNISAGSRRLSTAERALQQEGVGVKIVFTVGVKDGERATASQGLLNMLSSGAASLVSVFSSNLDTELQARGQPRVNLSAAAVKFSAPTIKQTSSASAGSSGIAAGQSGWSTLGSSGDSPTASGKTAGSSESSSTLLLVCVIGLVACAGYLLTRRSTSPKQAQNADFNGVNDAYASKIANLDQLQAADSGFEQ
jgi:hypothetical protein